MSSSESENLSLKIVTADYYLHKPLSDLGDQCYSAFRSSPVFRVPIIRIFGPTSEGVKTCLHVHGVFPYIFVPNWNDKIGEKELYNFAANLDKAINTSFAHSNSKSSHVHKITSVCGMPFYGYHESERSFLKIEFYNPAIVKRASDLLLNGAVLNTIFQPHEAHIPYILQFFIDNNLYGMNNITFSGYKVRKNNTQDEFRLDESIIGSNSGVCQQSYSSLEIDVTVSNLCNVLSNEENIPNNPGLAFIWEDEKKRRRFNQKSSQITPNESQQRPEKPVTRTENYFKEKLTQKLQAIKDNAICMDIDNDETSLNSTYEELNTQSKSLLEILQSLAGQQDKSKESIDSGSSSPSLVYSDDENNAADVSLITSQPLLKFNAEDDSILGNNFSDDENDIDDHDHRALSQTINYSRRQMSSSDDSDAEAKEIPQLDGAYDTKSTKKSAKKKVKPAQSRKKVIKLSSNNTNQDDLINKRTYNLRSQTKSTKESFKNVNFKPREFQIVLNKLDPPKISNISPKKTYPRLNIDTQKSPRSNTSTSSQDNIDIISEVPKILVHQLPTESSGESLPSLSQTRNESVSVPENSLVKSSKSESNNNVLQYKEPILVIPRLSDELSNRSASLPEPRTRDKSASLPASRSRNEFTSSFTESPSKKAHKSADSSLQKSDRKVYPQLEISIKKSPRSAQKPTVDAVSSSRGVANLQGLKKRKINFGEGENDSSKSKEIIQNVDLISPKWKKSLKKRKKDDTSFKIGNSFSLLGFRNSKKDQSVEKSCEKFTSLDNFTNSCEMNSQSYSLRLTGAECSSITSGALEESNYGNQSTEMDALQISEDKDAEIEVENDREPLMESDDESLLAIPLDTTQNDELQTRCSTKLSQSSFIKCPILKLPRLDPKTINDSMSGSFYEGSSIKLNISESIGVTSQSKLIENSNSTPSKFEQNTESDPKHESTHMPSQAAKSQPNIDVSMSQLIEKVVRDSKDELTEKITLQQPREENSITISQSTSSLSQNESNLVKVLKKPVIKKKSLGMRIRKNIKQSASSSKSKQNSFEPLPKTNDDGRSVEKLPMILVDQEDSQSGKDYQNLAKSSDLYPDSDIELRMSCTFDSLLQNSTYEVKTFNIAGNVDLGTSHQNISKNTIRDKNIPRNASEMSLPPSFEDSQLELDIFQFCSESVEDLAKETCNDERLPTVPTNENPIDQMDKVSSSSILNDSNVAILTEQKLIENENSNSSQSLFGDEILGKANTFLSDSAIGDNDAVYSPEIAFEENPLMNENLISSQSIFNDESPTESNFLNVAETAFDDNDLFYSQGVSSAQKSQQLIDDNDTYFSQIDPTEPTNNLNENLMASPSFFDDEFLYDSAPKVTDSSVQLEFTSNTSSSQLVGPVETSRNPNDIADDDDSNDSLLNVIDSLTPRTKEALNRNLNSFEGDNLPASISQRKNIFDDRATAAEPNQQPYNGLSEDERSNSKNPYENDSKQSKSLEESSSNILNKSSYLLNLGLDSSTAIRGPAHEAILFEEDSFDLEFPPLSENELVKKTPTLDKVLLNNSIWDSTDSDEASQEDNEIQSFYHNQTVNPAHITIIRDIAEDDDSSPIAKSLTPESQTSNEILSFYGSQSPDSMICSISEDLLKPTKAKSSTPVVESTTSSRTKRGSSPVVSHSALGGSSTSKKTPSPLYTPILKKLMIKKVNEKDKRRISSQRFRAEPFLSDIEEEKEIKRKGQDKNTTLSLPLELECDTSKIDGKSILNTSKTSNCSEASYQIDGASLENTCGFKMNLENLQDIKTDKQFQFITLISLEVFAQTRGDLKPDPEYDPITCLFYSIHYDAPDLPFLISGIIVVSEDPLSSDLERFKCKKTIVSNEVEMFDTFLALIRKWDPDMFIGYEVEMLSWGFLIQRGHFLGRNFSHELSRVRETKQNEPIEKAPYEDDDYSNEIKLTGRIVLNVWRLMRHEVNLQSYTFENILFHVLHQRVPCHDFKFLTNCWKNNFKKWIVVDYFLFRAESNITLLEQLDFICRTSELARLFGIQFYEVLSRGSQFRVESMMLRLAKTQNYVAVSPSVKQRAHMRAPESLPLIMEPESKFYTDPVIVLDFQSLYPSIIIAYNYCFSTCLGRIDNLGQNEPFHFGCVEHTVPSDLLVKLENSVNLSPAGVAFVNKSIRKGILPSMLEEILETRLMVKKSMKENKNNSILKRVLHARQLGLKLIANVTYGYTSANFSGRMPCMEIADSVVSKGRETLERAIELVNGTEKWGARVVYGDTDSLFVLVPNRTKEEAFRIGSEIADAVTNQNPKPVKLKLEKVYTASILQTKKRYVGYMYESPDQEKPTYDAKGIETVRRDGCPAVSKILEKSLKLLFETKNVHTVKQYVQRQFTKLISGRISIQELTFAREYRGLNNYKPAACVPALQLAKQALLKDRRAEPRIKERVRYVIVTGAPGVPLIRLVRTPREFLDTPGSLINTEYYITRAIIPALERCFTLMNVSVQAWYKEMPKKQKLNLPIDYEFRNKAFKKTTISHYFSSSKCISCSKIAGGSVCRECEHKPQRLALILGNMINQWQRRHNNVAKICRSCCGRNEPIGCSSLDCPVYYLFRQTDHDAEQVRYAENLKREYLYF